MAKNDPNFSYINENGKLVSGPPALLHYIYTILGGLSKYNDEVCIEYIEVFMEQLSETANKNLSKNAKKKQFKKVI